MIAPAHTSYSFSRTPIKINSPNVVYTEDEITTTYAYDSNKVAINSETNELEVTPETKSLSFKTQRKIGKVGLLLVGLGGNNGSTTVAGLIANKKKLTWKTKEGVQHADYLGSITQSSTVLLGSNTCVPMKNLLPMLDPNDLVVSGWDINNMNLSEAMIRAEVLPYQLQRELDDEMKAYVPMPSIYYKDFIAANQEDRANHLIPGKDKQKHLDHIRNDIRTFKATNCLDKVIILWTANTERFSSIVTGLNDTAENLLKSIKNSEDEVSPSSIFAVASILEGCTYINGSPQNTFVPGVMELAEREKVFIAGDDFKSGQTKMKSVLVDFLVSAGIKVNSIVSYNHLGNNDGKNLSAPQQFRSKEISKSTVVDDMVASNGIVYKEGEHPDHCVVIKYVPHVKDSKRAMDEYTSRIFMGGNNTIVMHNTCEDSLLATPLIYDLVILAELSERILVKDLDTEGSEYTRFHPVLSILSYLLKAPLVPRGAPVVNALFKQREAIVNIMKACIGLKPENHMLLEHRVPSMMTNTSLFSAAMEEKTYSSSFESKEKMFATSHSPAVPNSKIA